MKKTTEQKIKSIPKRKKPLDAGDQPRSSEEHRAKFNQLLDDTIFGVPKTKSGK